MNKITSFYIGSDNSSGMRFNEEDAFLEAIKEEIRAAEENGHKYFNVKIEQSE